MRDQRSTRNGSATSKASWVLGLLAVLLVAGQATADVTAKVVAIDQVIIYNRMGAFNPAGMIFALARDVFPKGTAQADETLANSCASVSCTPGNVQIRSTKRPRPITLRVNEGENIHIEFTNLLSPAAIVDAGNAQPLDAQLSPIVSEQPVTRTAGIHIQGMQNVGTSVVDGSKVGNNASSTPAPGDPAITYSYFAEKEGAYVISSGPNLGGEGGSGAIASGLFGVLNVEPAGAEWYRSQLTREEMILAADANCNGVLDPAETTPDHPYADAPLLAIRDAGGEIVHNELNAVITGPGRGGFDNDLPPTEVYPNRGEPFREMTIAFHDEVKIVQAFPQWYAQLKFTLGSVKDGFAINYGTGGIGSEIIGNRLGVGPMHECVECKYEEFFLTSWVVGDPAMIVDVPATIGLEACDPGLNNCDAVGPKATKAFYPDDPSNTWHGYLNDRTKVRNIHVGTEHHIFHLHAHQWLFASLDDDSNYLDAQLIGPGSSFTYEITYGGGGNRNKTAGDAIFHCHFYPHFAQGMWGLWRVHDTFELGSLMNADGTVRERGLPDGEITGGGYEPGSTTAVAGGTPTPAVVPLPSKAMAPLPGAYVASVDGDDDGNPDTNVPFMGYPFYIPGTPGHRPPTPPLDLVEDGGIPRHVITAGTAHQVQTPTDFDKVLEVAVAHQVPETGTVEEKAAMAFHGPQPAGVYHASYTPENAVGLFEVNGLPPHPGAPFAEPCRGDSYDGYPGQQLPTNRHYKASVVELDVDLNKVGWHFGQQRIIVFDGDVEATLAGTRAPEPFVMRSNTGDCVDFDHTNLVPNVYQLDDFQVKTPTDVIGQHIHLVKFDVMTADGAANGYNYEDGTLSPDETAERIHAIEAVGGSWTGPTPLGEPGPRTTRQRWYIDPGWSGNVFTHDHYGPSTHQQSGLYATLLIEPKGSKWTDPVTGEEFGTPVADGGPTSWRADIDCTNCEDPELQGDAWREFYLEFADFQLAYRGPQGDGAGFLNGPETPVNPSDRNEPGLPIVLEPNPLTCGKGQCRPEAISAADPGTFVVNYRNEPLAHRVRDPNTNTQAPDQIGDLALAYASLPNRADPRLSTRPRDWPYGDQATAVIGAERGDPFTPMLRAYEGDKVYLRVQVGAHEEGHNFSINGINWLQQWASQSSGFRNSQAMGISEYFIFRVPNVPDANGTEDYLYQAGSSVDAKWNGSWGLLRTYGRNETTLRPLPNNLDGRIPRGNANEFQGICPRDVVQGNAAVGQLREYTVRAVQAQDVLPGGALEYNPELNDPTALMYVLEEDLDPVTGQLKAERRVEPLILRAAAGDCIDVRLENRLPEVLHGPDPLFPANTQDLAGFNTLPMIVNHFNANQLRPSSRVGLHAQLVAYDVFDSDGMSVGGNRDQTASPGANAMYRWYAGMVEIDSETGIRTATPVEFGAANLMAADPIKGSNKGLIGALVIEPVHATWPAAGEVGTDGLLTRAAVTVTHPGGSFRDLVAVYQDDVNMRFTNAQTFTPPCIGVGAPCPPISVIAGEAVPTVSEEEEPEDSGMKGLNYSTDPIWLRLGIGPTMVAGQTRRIDFTDAFAGEPVTPVFTAAAGQQLRFRVLKPGGHNRNHVFHLHGHVWPRHPFNADSTVIDVTNQETFWHGEQMGHGPSNHINAVPLNGAGGVNGVPGDYLYRDIVPVHVYNGEWGILRVQ
jgi:hypothetical protein